MSLRAFHLLFIALSVILAAFFAAWAVEQYRSVHQDSYIVVSVVSLACGIALAVYGLRFSGKREICRRLPLRKALTALIVLGLPKAAFACPVCFGQNDSPLAVAMNNGILFMLGFVVAVLVCFASFFIYLVRRANLVAAQEGSIAETAGYQPSEGTAQC
jgi:hypothetical protein